LRFQHGTISAAIQSPISHHRVLGRFPNVARQLNAALRLRHTGLTTIPAERTLGRGIRIGNEHTTETQTARYLTIAPCLSKDQLDVQRKVVAFKGKRRERWPLVLGTAITRSCQLRCDLASRTFRLTYLTYINLKR
jgi:hypothetical protein